MKEWKKDFKLEMETIKKTLKEATLEVENLKKKSEVTDASISNRLQEMDERISGPKTTLKTLTQQSEKMQKPKSS